MAKTASELSRKSLTYHRLMVKVDRAGLSMHKRERVSDRYWKAWWYASGIDDTEGTNYADSFAYEHGMDTFLYESGQEYQLFGIRDAYKSFRDEV